MPLSGTQSLKPKSPASPHHTHRPPLQDQSWQEVLRGDESMYPPGNKSCNSNDQLPVHLRGSTNTRNCARQAEFWGFRNPGCLPGAGVSSLPWPPPYPCRHRLEQGSAACRGHRPFPGATAWRSPWRLGCTPGPTPQPPP